MSAFIVLSIGPSKAIAKAESRNYFQEEPNAHRRNNLAA